MSNSGFNTVYKLLDGQAVTNCYKHLFFASIIYFVRSGHTEIDLNLSAGMMIQFSWELVTEDNLSLGKQDNIASVIKELRYLPFFDTCINGYAVYEFLKDKSNQYFDELVGKLNNYVPYRLLSPFYETELRGLDDSVKNAKIKELSAADPNAFYQIGKGKIVINEKWSAFINENYSTICNYISEKFAAYLSKKNPNADLTQLPLRFQ